MPLALWEFLLAIPFTVLVFFAPFILAASWRGRPVAHLVHGYLGTTAVIVVVFAALSLWENA